MFIFALIFVVLVLCPWVAISFSGPMESSVAMGSSRECFCTSVTGRNV